MFLFTRSIEKLNKIKTCAIREDFVGRSVIVLQGLQARGVQIRSQRVFLHRLEWGKMDFDVFFRKNVKA